MAQNSANDKSENANEPKKFVDEATQEKIHKHLMDINDTISEQDIKNIKTDISSPEQSTDKDSGESYPEESKKIVNEKNESPDKQKDDMPTSWNMLDEN